MFSSNIQTVTVWKQRNFEASTRLFSISALGKACFAGTKKTSTCTQSTICTSEDPSFGTASLLKALRSLRDSVRANLETSLKLVMSSWDISRHSCHRAYLRVLESSSRLWFIIQVSLWSFFRDAIIWALILDLIVLKLSISHWRNGSLLENGPKGVSVTGTRLLLRWTRLGGTWKWAELRGSGRNRGFN